MNRQQDKANQGVVYLLDGTQPAARLVVSVATLRRHYDGLVAVITTDESAGRIGNLLKEDDRLDVEHIPVVPDLGDEPHRPFLLKTLVHRFTPFATTVFLDCDTIVRGTIAPLFEFPSNDHVLVTHFNDWRTDRPPVSRRIKSWISICPELVRPALRFGKAINTGVFAFTQQSVVLRRWFNLTYQGRHNFIPDEIAMQLLLPRVPNVVLNSNFNCSAKFGSPSSCDVRIVHFHGRKHVGEYGELWLAEYADAVSRNLAHLCEWTPAGDRHLRCYLDMQGEGVC